MLDGVIFLVSIYFFFFSKTTMRWLVSLYNLLLVKIICFKSVLCELSLAEILCSYSLDRAQCQMSDICSPLNILLPFDPLTDSVALLTWMIVEVL